LNQRWDSTIVKETRERYERPGRQVGNSNPYFNQDPTWLQWVLNGTSVLELSTRFRIKSWVWVPLNGGIVLMSLSTTEESTRLADTGKQLIFRFFLKDDLSNHRASPDDAIDVDCAVYWDQSDARKDIALNATAPPAMAHSWGAKMRDRKE
jgi:hypothetical protein